MSANAQWPPAQILAYALAHVAHFRVSDLKALLASLGAARGTSQWNKSALLAKVTSELTVRGRAYGCCAVAYAGGVAAGG